MAGYIGSKAVITSGVSASIDELNLIDGVTATTAELNYNDTGAAVGVVVASKTVTADANKDVASFRNITLTGELDAGSLDISGNADIDGTLETDALSIAGVAVTTTAAEINLIDGGTARGTTAIVDADGVLVNDAGTMRMTTMATLATYMGTKGLGPAYTRATSAPSSPNAGDWFFHTTFNSLYIYDATDGWVTDSARDFGSGRLMAANTFSILVNASGSAVRVRFEPDASFSDALYRSSPVSHTYTDNTDTIGAVSNTVRGVFTQHNTATTNAYAFVALGTNAIAENFGNSVTTLAYVCGCDHATRGVFAGPYISGDTNHMEYITIASAGNGSDFGNLSVSRSEWGCQALANTTRGVFPGGSTGSVSDVMDYITILTAGNATDFGNLTAASNLVKSACSIVRGLIFAGNGRNQAIDYITIASAGNATDFGDHIDTANSNKAFAVHNKIYAYYTRVLVGNQEKHTIATAANATAFLWVTTAGLNEVSQATAPLKGWIAASG